ncbi:cysteine desulfurase [Candidatus Woesearchaeota archaeon]|nr:cysteine desulfurase [Candidatus Woesearchaeota archaeon]
MNVEKIRQDFPILAKKINNKPIVYMDSACMSLRPVQVINKINSYYNEFPACGGRSAHKFGKRLTEEIWKARKSIQKFFSSKKESEIVFTKNTTEAINLVAHSLDLKNGDVVLATDKEHNSNLLPWLLMAKKGIKHEAVLSKEDNTFDLEKFEQQMSKNVKLVPIVHTSNLDGTTIPAKEVIKIAHDYNALVLLDAAQSVPHKELNVKKLDVDFLACSGHKMLGPSGTGILYGKQRLLEEINPFMVGGETVTNSTYSSFDLENPPEKFEAGLQNYAGIVGLGEAARYLMKVGRQSIGKHEVELNKIISQGLLNIEGTSIIGPQDPELRSGIVSFTIDKKDPHEIALMLDETSNIMVRSGAHCVHSWFNAHNLKGSVRASLYLYNTREECEFFVESLKKVLDIVR